MATQSLHWQQQIGSQRDWFWRGWKVRYTYQRPAKVSESRNPPIILLHGFGASIGHWRYNIKPLSQHHTVYALDLLGFGASKKAVANYGTKLWVAQIHDFWQTFIKEPAIIVGNSLGSLVAMTVAATHPEMVAGLAMINLPDVSLQQEAIPPWLRPIERGMKRMIASPLLLKSIFRVVRQPGVIRRWAAIAYSDLGSVNEDLVNILAIPPQDQGAAKAFCYLFRGASNPEFAPGAKETLPTLHIPMLLIWGRQDKFVPPSLAPVFARLNPLITLVELDNAGHCPHDECPDRFNQIFLDWLS